MKLPFFQTIVPAIFSRRTRASQGVSIVEFVIILPVMIMLLLITFEMGRFLVRGYLPLTNIV